MKTTLPTQAPPMRHAFIVVGTETIFFCHQIMSHMEGHNYEFVLEVELEEDVKKEILLNRLEGNSHFIANKAEDLMTLAQVKAGTKTSFKADVWNSIRDKRNPPNAPWGDPENPDVDPWIADIIVNVKRIVHYRHINLNSPSRLHEQYILFGKGEEAHIYHSIVWQPEYDHVASLAKVPEWISQDQLAASIVVSILDLPWRSDNTYCDVPLESCNSYGVLYYGITQYFGEEGKPSDKVPDYSIDIEVTHWFSIRIVNFFNTPLCPNSPQISMQT